MTVFEHPAKVILKCILQILRSRFPGAYFKKIKNNLKVILQLKIPSNINREATWLTSIVSH